MLLSPKARYFKDGGADRQGFEGTTGSSALIVEICLDPRGLGPGRRQACPNFPIGIEMFCGEVVGQSALSDGKPKTYHGIERVLESRRGRRWLRQQPAYWLQWVKPLQSSNPFPLRQISGCEPPFLEARGCNTPSHYKSIRMNPPGRLAQCV